MSAASGVRLSAIASYIALLLGIGHYFRREHLENGDDRQSFISRWKLNPALGDWKADAEKFAQ